MLMAPRRTLGARVARGIGPTKRSDRPRGRQARGLGDGEGQVAGRAAREVKTRFSDGSTGSRSSSTFVSAKTRSSSWPLPTGSANQATGSRATNLRPNSD